MTAAERLSTDLVAAALAHLGVPAGAPTLELLASIVAAYPSHVPWETASRIVHGRIERVRVPRKPSVFWRDAITLGAGGTCFESNRAVAALLAALEYPLTLTINDMDKRAACHTAIIVTVEGERWLVDMGLPVHALLRLDPDAETSAESPFHRYSACPVTPGRFDIMRTDHPRPRCFSLRDCAVGLPAYDDAARADYGPDGLFLDQLIITKVIAGRIWRYRGDEDPHALAWFERTRAGREPLPEDPVPRLAEHFAIDEPLLRRAWEHLTTPAPGAA